MGEFKSRFSEVVETVRLGREVGVLYGKKRQKIGVFVPVSVYKRKAKRKLGILGARASFELGPDFKITDEEFLAS